MKVQYGITIYLNLRLFSNADNAEVYNWKTCKNQVEDFAIMFISSFYLLAQLLRWAETRVRCADVSWMTMPEILILFIVTQ